MNHAQANQDTFIPIRNARADEIEIIQHIDLRSCELFDGTGLIDFGPASVQLDAIPEGRLRQGLGDGLLWTATDYRDLPVGFALCAHKQDCMYLDQVSVTPEFGQQGIGEQLVLTAIEAAKSNGYRQICLSTFRDVPWNGKFYRRLGFREIPFRKLLPWQIELQELQRATMDISKRCFMQKSVKRLFF